MKRSFRIHRAFLLPALLLASSCLLADIVVLKSGEQLNGKIVAEDAASITLEYQLTPKIKDKKVIQKTDIKENGITRFTPAQIAFDERGLAKFETSGDLLTASDYESIIQDNLRTFAALFPGTPEAARVEKMIANLSEEKNKVLAGQVKMEGKWLDESTAKREKYNIDAYRLRMGMKKKAADVSQDLVQPKEIGALRQFDALRTQFPASTQYLQAIPEALEILDKYEARLRAMAAEQPVLKAEREKAVNALQGSELQRVQDAIKQEETIFRATSTEEAKNKVKWRSVYKYDLKSITDAQTATLKEKTELKNINLVALQNEVENLSAAIRYIADGNAAEAEVVMGRLRPTKNSLLNKKSFDEIDKKLKELQSKLARELKISKTTSTSAASTTTPGETTDSSNPLADALKKKDDAKAKEDAKKKKAAEATAATVTRPSVAADEEQTLLQKVNAYIPYIGGGLLVVLIIAMVMGKKKKEEDE